LCGFAGDRSVEALEDARVVLEALADNPSVDALDAAQDVREGRPDWRFMRRLDLVAMARAHTKAYRRRRHPASRISAMDGLRAIGCE
jgi:hypothetical protein